MANKDGKKKTSGVRNDSRKNGKAFGKKKFDSRGRALTGRGKPSGHSIKGVSIKKIARRMDHYWGYETIDLTRNKAA